MSAQTVPCARHQGRSNARFRHMRAVATRTLVRVGGLCTALLAAPTAWACPDCTLGEVARAQFWNDYFATNLLIALAPFVAMVAAAALGERLLGQRGATEGHRQ